jgi:hypothetical protein
VAERYQPEDGVAPKEIVVKGDGALLVSWQDVSHPWASHRFVAAEKDPKDPRLADAMNRFSSILAPFCGRGFGGLTRARRLIDNRPVGRTPLGQALHQHLLAQGILNVDGRLYRLDQKRLSDLRITWQSLMRRQMSAELRNFLTAFLRTFTVSP